MKILVFLALLGGCSSTTIISVADRQAKIYVDHEYLGEGVVTHIDHKILGMSTLVVAKKDGCRDNFYRFYRLERVDHGALLMGITVLPLFWVMKYHPVHHYPFVCQ